MSKVNGEDRVKARVIKRAEQLQDRLGLGWLTFTHRFDSAVEGERVVCVATADWEYRQCGFRWNIPLTMLLSDEELDSVIVHEYVHALNASVWTALTSKQQDALYRHNEYATENVARAILAALQK